ncbi:MAG: MogA/MoaB family molybdenum cofactor biosynthesis protein [Spirochaetaceae bacterium]|nr:MogA/MoaB family molybdenum cofactor biosynthesis protein [Spirochaetaceae bacterium]
MHENQGRQINRYRVAVIAASDKGARGERQDESGPAIAAFMTARGYAVTHTVLLPDDEVLLQDEMRRLADAGLTDLILTTGGTGFSPRDRTPEATLAIADRTAPGIAEAMRMHSFQFTKRAMLSRAVSVLRKQTLIINLPGSPQAVREHLDFIADELPHALAILRGDAEECGRH